MTGLKLTILWNFIAQGFSETWYSAQTSLPSKPDDPVIKKFVDKRNLMTSSAVELVGWRVTDLSNPRATLIYRNPGGSNPAGAPDTPTNAWLFDCKVPGGRGTRQLWLRGIPDSDIVWSPADLKFKITPALQKAMDNFSALLKAGPWGIRTVKSYTATAVKALVANIAAGPLGASTKLTGAGPGAAANGPIIVSGFKRPLSPLNGIYQYRSGYLIDGADILILGKSFSAAQQGTYTGGGAVRVPEYVIQLVGDPQPVGPRERRVGGAFSVPVGRRRR